MSHRRYSLVLVSLIVHCSPATTKTINFQVITSAQICSCWVGRRKYNFHIYHPKADKKQFKP